MARDSANWRETRRKFLATTGIAGAGLAAGCVGDDSDDTGDDTTDVDDTGDDSAAGTDDTGDDSADDGTTTDEEPTEVNWIMNPAEETVDIEIQYQPLFEHLESEANVEIVGQPTANYAATVAELERAREGDRVFADTSPGAVAQIPDEIDVVGMRLAFGSELYFSLIVTTPDSGIEELADLEGHDIATGGATSVSGTIVPMLMLQEAGLDTGGAPDGQPNDFGWRPSDHQTARIQLIEDDNIAAATTGAFSTAAHVPPEQFEEMSPEFVEISSEWPNAGTRDPELKLLGVSDPIPRAPIVVNAAWDEPLRYELEQLMLDAEPEDFQHDPVDLANALAIDPAILDKDEDELTEDEQDDLNLFDDHTLWFDGIEPADHSDFQPVVDILEELGLDPEDV